MLRIGFLLIVAILIVLLSYWIIKLITKSKHVERRYKDSNKTFEEKLEDLEMLKRKGIISDEEFEKLKNDLLN